MSDKQEFIYVIRLQPAYLDRSIWTDKENNIIEEHFQYLLQLKEAGELILAGRTQTSDEKTFGIVILRVDNELEARLIMEQDPAVANQLMTSELYPYSIAVM
ncbi:YciI family protein [Paenibacillus sp. HWE-109]|uniref:YciI family protein n=1 Tax=Paenibacillus sp. HWE-109 TaxID=1306526 RepID=UPI001EDFC3E8|nr:YciI family protein [Paenibacillus sp. HWE-109]UKS29092.1 YciI family protein [Paenibacillus sp. HWE-109]